MTLLIVWSDIAKSEPPTFYDFFTENTITENSGENVFFTFQALDPDDPDSEISFNLTGPDSNDFRIGRSDGGLYFRTAPDYENPTDDDEDNVYEITVVATDQDKEKTRIKATVTISNVDDEVPRIKQWKRSYSIPENTRTVQTFEVSDDFLSEGGSVSLSISSSDARPDGANFAITDRTTLKFSRPPDFEQPRDENKDNEYRFVLTATDEAGNSRTYNQTVVVTDQIARQISFTITPATHIQEDTSSPKSYCSSGGFSFSPQKVQPAGYGSYETATVLGWLGRHTCEGTENSVGNYYDDYIYQIHESDPITTVRLTMENTRKDCSAGSPVCGNPSLSVYGAVPGANMESIGSNYSTDKVKSIQLPAETGTYWIRVTDYSAYYAGAGKQSYVLDFSRETTSAENWTMGEAKSSQLSRLPKTKPADPLRVGTTKLQQLALPSSKSNGVLPTKSLMVTRKLLTTSQQRAFRKRKYKKSLTKKARTDLRRIYQKYNIESVIGFKTFPLDSKDLRIASRLLRGDVNTTNPPNEADGYDANDPSGIPGIVANDPSASVSHLVELLNLAYPAFEFSTNSLVYAHQKFSPDADYAAKQKKYMDLINLPAGLDRIGAQVKAPIVAVIDTGGPAIGSVADQATNFVDGGYDFISDIDSAGDGDGFDDDPTDPNACDGDVDCPGKYESGSHGTHVATTIGAKNDGLDINGFGVRVASMRALGIYGYGYSSDICNAIAYAADIENDTGTTFSEVSGGESVNVINMSLGSTGSCQCQSVIDQAVKKGVTVVASAGNNNDDRYSFPASCDGVVSVAATNSSGVRSYYSSFNNSVDIAGPGGDAFTNADYGLGNDRIWAFDSNSGLAGYQGTSMAAPIVSGVIANLYAARPNIKPATIDGLIAKEMMSDDRGPEDYDPFYGAGVVDLLKALKNVRSSKLDAETYVRAPTGISLGLKSGATFSIQKEGEGQAYIELPYSDSSALKFSAVDIDSSGFGTYKVRVNRNKVYWDDRHIAPMFVPVHDVGGTRNLKIPVLFQKGNLSDARLPQSVADVLLWNRTTENVTLHRSINNIRGTESILLDVEDGDYNTVISTDIDQDGKYCDFGELCWKRLSWTNSDDKVFEALLSTTY